MLTDGDLRANVARRLMMDVWLDGSAAYWRRRARQLDDARPRPGDFVGNATPDDLARCAARLDEAAAACLARASLADIARAEAGDVLTDLSRGAA